MCIIFEEDYAHVMPEGSTLPTADQRTALKPAKFHKLKPEEARNVIPRGQILPESGDRELSIGSPHRSLENSSGDTHANEPGLPTLPEVMEIYSAYINELPTYLVYVPEKRLLSRPEVNEMFHRDVSAVTEDDITKVLARPTVLTREEAVKIIVRRKLKYAIFSHKWIEQGEPTFRDIMMSIQPAGYGKFLNFCARAAEYKCRLAWSDTCCINKECDVEVEEAIRSMFNWYRNAHVCIAHLSDATSVDDLWKDVWFTRGWILQELLAPRMIKFYGQDWVPLTNSVNDKKNFRMVNALSRRTGIPRHDICRFRPGTRDVHKKMMWASSRTTTRVEDTAYCLIGIFDVNLTIAYGEGRRAFYRLMEKIVNRCEEWEIMAWAGQPSADSAALPESPRCYKALAESFSVPSCNSDQRTWRGRRQFFMTEHGLQLKLLVVDLPSSSMKLFVGANQVTECTRYGECTVGVIDYWYFDKSDGQGLGRGVLRPGQDHLCWLLSPYPSGTYMKVSTTELLFIRTDVEVEKDLSMLWL